MLVCFQACHFNFKVFSDLTRASIMGWTYFFVSHIIYNPRVQSTRSSNLSKPVHLLSLYKLHLFLDHITVNFPHTLLWRWYASMRKNHFASTLSNVAMFHIALHHFSKSILSPNSTTPFSNHFPPLSQQPNTNSNTSKKKSFFFVKSNYPFQANTN